MAVLDRFDGMITVPEEEWTGGFESPLDVVFICLLVGAGAIGL